MATQDEDARLTPSTLIVVGEDLSAQSLEDLAERRAALEEEITRIDKVVAAKTATRAAADSLFKS
tara:strand:+ start:2849 stop:3043 length:195 start_codon:yes stop_codon:yes gene_type:complete